MPDYSTALIGLIDGRIDQAQVKPTKMGTVQGRESNTARAFVVFDGSAGVSQPVKCFETVLVDIGDRVGMVRFEGEWVIVGNYTPRTFADAATYVDGLAGTTTSASFGDVPSSPGVSFNKYRDVTQFQIFVAISMFTTVAPTVVEMAVNIRWPDATQADQVLYHRSLNAASDHRDSSGGITTPGLTLPAGSYVFVARWRRVSGTGTLSMDSNDGCHVHVKEVLT